MIFLKMTSRVRNVPLFSPSKINADKEQDALLKFGMSSFRMISSLVVVISNLLTAQRVTSQTWVSCGSLAMALPIRTLAMTSIISRMEHMIIKTCTAIMAFSSFWNSISVSLSTNHLNSWSLPVCATQYLMINMVLSAIAEVYMVNTDTATHAMLTDLRPLICNNEWHGKLSFHGVKSLVF